MMNLALNREEFDTRLFEARWRMNEYNLVGEFLGTVDDTIKFVKELEDENHAPSY